MSTATFEVPGLPLPVAVRRMANARRLRLRIDHDRQLLRLTVPARGSARAALRWVGEQRAWIEQQLALAPGATPFADGATVPFRGDPLTIRWQEADRRGARQVGSELHVGGPRPSLARSVQRWLLAAAREELSAETGRIAAAAAVSVRSVSVGDAASRWGSCSAAGAIRYSWRLILAPPPVLRFVVAHEVAHRLHMDHSPAFKAAEERLFGGPTAEARRLLRELGPALRRVGRGS
uniref:M48 family metallopeptidase n=1 Tax=uncultured Sphingomonas sp. TaxID=158754 RepID=UPI0025D83B28|nr:YgjP-like metallopeptidase domain-containing protein [uncultured Sphingomonas sp.]